MHALPVKFHLKSIFPSNWMMPLVYLVINLSVTGLLLNIVAQVKVDKVLDAFGIVLIPLTLLSIVFYMLAAYTNPGLLIGDETVQLKKAQDWNYKHQR